MEDLKKFLNILKKDFEDYKDNIKIKKQECIDFYNNLSDRYDRSRLFRICFTSGVTIIGSIFSLGVGGILALITIAYPVFMFGYMYFAMLALIYVLLYKG